MSVEAEEIVIENIGPVEQLRIPLPVGGGLVVLTGDNGAGKSETLTAIRALCGSADDKKSLRPHDGEKSGSIEGCGVTIKVGRSNRETGELTVAALEDRLDIADLVDPGIADLNAADARRLKSLIRVAGAKADLNLFAGLLGDAIELDTKITKEVDLINMAGGVKRTLEAKARAEETKSEASRDQAAMCLKTAEGVDVSGESDEEVLQQQYRDAASHESTLNQARKSCLTSMNNREQAQRALDAAKDQYNGPTPDDARETLSQAAEVETQAADNVATLTEDLRIARETLAIRQSRRRQCETTLTAADQHETTIAAWETQIAADTPVMPRDEHLQQAADDLQAATKAMQNGAIVRRAKSAIAQADDWNAKRKSASKAAENYRESARGVDEVLSQVVAGLGCPIKVGEDDKGLRLTIQHPKRGLTYFSELSMGEKYGVVIPIAVKAVGPGGLCCLKQEAFEGLQPSVKKKIAELVKGTHVTLITAQCADGPLMAGPGYLTDARGS